MKTVIQSLIVGLLLAEAGAYRLAQQQMIRLRDSESDDVDADDPDINDGPTSEQAVLAYQQTFLNDGQSVNKLNKNAVKAAEDQQRRDDEYDVEENMNYALPMTKDTNQKNQKKTVFYTPGPKVAHPVRFVQMTTDAEAHKKSRELELEPENIRENTNLWANSHAAEDGPPRVETIEVGEIETSTMNLKEKSDLLHNVALSAQTDLKEQIQTQRESEDERKKEIYKQAENLDLQVMDLEKMNFSAHELNNYEALT